MSHRPFSVGVSSPVSVAPRRLPDEALRVPTSCSTPLALSVKSLPLWQLVHWPLPLKICWPATASAVSVPSALRNGLAPTLVSELT